MCDIFPVFNVDYIIRKLLRDESNEKGRIIKSIESSLRIFGSMLKEAGIAEYDNNSIGFADKNENQKIFNYFAAGWNRDGLALRAAGDLIKSAPEGRHLLLLLTDASPNDSHRIPPGEGNPFGREYAEQAAVKDTTQEVRALQRRGIRVAAVFMGNNYSAPDAAAIYEKSMVRIQGIDQLATAAGALIRQEIQELTD